MFRWLTGASLGPGDECPAMGGRVCVCVFVFVCVCSIVCVCMCVWMFV